MPNGIPVATVALNGAKNAGILAASIIGSGDKTILNKMIAFKAELKDKVLKSIHEVESLDLDYNVSKK
jgi:5-(carboxyamino)imidazole ribonucleotide mutase